MHFGLMNAPSAFQKMMDGILQSLKFAMVHVDEVVSFSKNVDENVGHCKEVSEKTKEENMQIKVTKCSFAQSEVNLLGHVINATRVQV